ncbi:kynureninase [Dactylosporangium sp. CA-139114]|uniref:kynureninase n=1 Tax=Dactylosporangium sp. CA-139114 TaxID=3239931 RepID=UPI003D96EB75
MDLSRQYAESLDAQDPIGHFRAQFYIPDTALVYFDGNSLGRLPLATRERLRDAIDREWGHDLIRGWDTWIDLARSTGDLLAASVLHVLPGEVVLSDSTSVNLYKLAAAALDARPGRGVIVTDDDNFPTDRYVLEGLAAARGLELRVVTTDLDAGVDPQRVAAALDDDVALVCLSHVAYRSGAIADMVAITTAAHRVGALTLWDLCHSAGSVRVPLRESGADLAVGCTYKYLNAGPGAPAFLYVRRDLQATLRQPIWGWFGRRDQFAMGAGYEPAGSVDRFLVGTPPVLGGYAALEGARITAAAGIDALAAKGAALTDYAIGLAAAWLGDRLALASPRESARRGSHVTFRAPEAWPICQALKAAGVIPDFRTPERLRIGLAPLYTRFVDVHEGMARLRDVVDTGAYLSYGAELGRVT